MDEQATIVELIDENDQTVSFEHIMTLEYNEQEYVVLIPLDEDGNDEEDEGVVILKVEADDNGDDVYVTIEDEGELDNVYQAFLEVVEGDMLEDEEE